MMNREQAVENVEKAVEALVNLTWELHRLQCLTPMVREILLQTTLYYLEMVMLADPLRGLDLMKKLTDLKVQHEAEGTISKFEDLLKDQAGLDKPEGF